MRDTTMLDVGSGNGIRTMMIAEDFQPRKVILTDIEDNLTARLPSNAEFQIADAQSPEFLARFQNRVNLVTCFSAFHEFSNPLLAATQLLTVLPKTGMTVILEASAVGWIKRGAIIQARGDRSQREHYEKNLCIARQRGFDNDDGIRFFWEKQVFPRVPGKTLFRIGGEM